MISVVKNSFYSIIGLSLIGFNNANAAINFEQEQVQGGVKGSEVPLNEVLANWLTYLVGFLYFVAIAMMIYGAFNIITAGGDEEKVKKGKTILIQAVAGLVVVFIANSIVKWLIDGLFGAAGGGN